MISAVILAAGRSSRMGRTKQLIKLGGETLLERVVQSFLISQVDEVVVVLGHAAKEIMANTDLKGSRVVVNAAYAEGLSSSLRLGISSVSPDSRAAIVGLGDQPMLSVETIDALVRKYSEGAGLVVAPFFRRRMGNPVLFDRSLFDELAAIKGDMGAKSVVKRHRGDLVRVPVNDIGVVLDIDSEEDYRRAAGGAKNS